MYLQCCNNNKKIYKKKQGCRRRKMDKVEQKALIFISLRLNGRKNYPFLQTLFWEEKFCCTIFVDERGGRTSYIRLFFFTTQKKKNQISLIFNKHQNITLLFFSIWLRWEMHFGTSDFSTRIFFQTIKGNRFFPFKLLNVSFVFLIIKFIYYL